MTTLFQGYIIPVYPIWIQRNSVRILATKLCCPFSYCCENKGLKHLKMIDMTQSKYKGNTQTRLNEFIWTPMCFVGKQKKKVNYLPLFFCIEGQNWKRFKTQIANMLYSLTVFPGSSLLYVTWILIMLWRQLIPMELWFCHLQFNIKSLISLSSISFSNDKYDKQNGLDWLYYEFCIIVNLEECLM